MKMYQTDVTPATLFGSCLQVEQGSDARIYSSFPINEDLGSAAHTTPLLPFSVIFFSEVPASSRFFCSAEAETRDPTPMECQHVSQFLQAFLSEWIHSGHVKRTPNGSPAGQIIIGSVNTRWIPVAKALGQDVVSNDKNICTKFIRPPKSPAPESKLALLEAHQTFRVHLHTLIRDARFLHAFATRGVTSRLHGPFGMQTEASGFYM